MVIIKQKCKFILVCLFSLSFFVGCKNLLTSSEYSNIQSGFDNDNLGIMIFKVQTSGNNEVFRLPLPPGFNYDFVVNWGDGSVDDEVTAFNDPEIFHTFATVGEYTITITGTVEAFNQTAFPATCIITEVVDLGDMKWLSLEGAFYGCAQLGAVNGGVTSGVTSMRGMFVAAVNATPNTSNWDTSRVTNMEAMFASATLANPDTSNWNVSSVTNMAFMFQAAESANPVTSGWNTSSAIIMSGMFNATVVANPDTSNWNVSSVTAMNDMFSLSNANPNVTNWNVSSVTNLEAMFNENDVANPDVRNWNTSSVTNMHGVFRLATSANPNVRNWNVLNVTTMADMFGGATLANPDLSLWDVRNVTSMENMLSLSGISNLNYSNYLIRAASLPVQNGVTLRAAPARYQPAAASARTTLTGSRGWTIVDSGPQ